MVIYFISTFKQSFYRWEELDFIFKQNILAFLNLNLPVYRHFNTDFFCN